MSKISVYVIKPIEITDSMIVSNDFDPSSYLAWDSGTTYNVGDNVVRPNQDGILHEYRWAQPTEDSGTYSNLDPAYYYVTNIADIDTDAKTTDELYLCYWLDLGPTNDWAMFDRLSTAISTATDQATIEITPGEIINGVGIVNSDAKKIRITATDPTDGIVYDEVFDMLDLTDCIDPYTWLFEPIIYKPGLATLDIPPYGDATIKIIFYADGEFTIGEIVLGKATEIGNLRYGTTRSTASYTDKSSDDSGLYSYTKQPGRRVVKYRLRTNTNRLDFLSRRFDELDGIPALWVRKNEDNDDFNELTVFGSYDDFEIDLAGPVKCNCSLTVEEWV